MRRTAVLAVAVPTFLAVVVGLPVSAAPVPHPVPVRTATTEVAMGSVAAPAAQASVVRGTTAAGAGAPASAGPATAAPDAAVPHAAGPVDTTAPVLAATRLRTAPFSMVGVTWTFDPAVDGTVAEVRVAGADGRWGGWTELSGSGDDVDVPAGTAGAARRAHLRGGTEPLWTGERSAVEVQLLTRSGAAPRDVRVQLLEPGHGDADAALGAGAVPATAHAAGAMPPIYSRAQWGADESIRTWDPEYAPTIEAMAVHHTDDTNGYTADQVPAMIRAIYQFHAVSRGWGDIGYNVLVDRFGHAWEGRYGGLASTVIGAHTGGFNTGTFGVAVIGTFVSDTPPAAALETLARVVAWKFTLYGVDPNGTAQLTSAGGGTDRYPVGAVVTLPTIFGHQDTGSTLCPGAQLYAKLPSLRARVATLIATTPTVRWWELRDGYAAGPAPYQVRFGDPTVTTLACDTDGDGRDDLVAYQDGTWYVRTSSASGPDTGPPTATFQYGAPGWVPVCGDWNGTGRDGIGVWDPSTGTWYLRSTASPGAPDVGVVQYGWSAATPVVGDWDGNGTDTIGVYQRGAGNWMVRQSNRPGPPDVQFQYGFPGAVPVPADFDGNGRTDVAVFSGGTWWVRTSSFGPGNADRVFAYGLPTDQPLTGDWDGRPGDGIGVSRPAVR